MGAGFSCGPRVADGPRGLSGLPYMACSDATHGSHSYLNRRNVGRAHWLRARSRVRVVRRTRRNNTGGHVRFTKKKKRREMLKFRLRTIIIYGVFTSRTKPPGGRGEGHGIFGRLKNRLNNTWTRLKIY